MLLNVMGYVNCVCTIHTIILHVQCVPYTVKLCVCVIFVYVCHFCVIVHLISLLGSFLYLCLNHTHTHAHTHTYTHTLTTLCAYTGPCAHQLGVRVDRRRPEEIYGRTQGAITTESRAGMVYGVCFMFN
ncbi:hypothetical protein EON63_07480 [archaeon]|nr:MAG: hypothetical protein EON63_07480 [archaeon]